MQLLKTFVEMSYPNMLVLIVHMYFVHRPNRGTTICGLRYELASINHNLISAYTVYPKKYAHGLLHWHCGNLTNAPVPAKQPWRIWINTSCEFIINDCVTTTKQSTTKPCAYFLGYTVIWAKVHPVRLLLPLEWLFESPLLWIMQITTSGISNSTMRYLCVDKLIAVINDLVTFHRYFHKLKCVR